MSHFWIVFALLLTLGIGYMAVAFLEIPVTPFQVIFSSLAILGVFAVAIGIYAVSKLVGRPSMKHRDFEYEAEQFAIKHLAEKYGMYVENKDGKSTVKYIPPDKTPHVGFLFHRITSDSERAGLPVTVVVNAKTMSLVDKDFAPSGQLQESPLKTFLGEYSGAPSPEADPSKDPSFYSKDYQRRGMSINLHAGGPMNETRKPPEEED